MHLLLVLLLPELNGLMILSTYLSEIGGSGTPGTVRAQLQPSEAGEKSGSVHGGSVYGGSQNSLNSNTTVSSSGVSSLATMDDPEQIIVAKQKKETMEEGIKRFVDSVQGIKFVINNLIFNICKLPGTTLYYKSYD